ncbi:hypothetical protein [Paenibacillus sp. YYML68]|uniref:hypothetical protein n=1 Tax=Paenibacillus sp. YYML68 TaxID=2909250 RepID=UPI002491A5C1|nr:hypothetical protein [Paenibacillus sp. YYML68]
MKHFKQGRTRIACLWLVAGCMALGAISPVSAADSPGSAAISGISLPVIGQVDADKSTTFGIKNVAILPGQGNKTVTFSLSITNNSTADLQFIDYWVRLRTTSGNRMTVKVLPQDKDKNRIPAQSTETISFYAVVNEKTTLQDLVFDVIKWDFSQPSFERKLGEVAVPADYSVITPVGSAQEVRVAGSPLHVSINKMYVGKNEKNYTPTVKLHLANNGSQSVSMPSYLYYIRTSEGYMYPLNAKGTKELTLHPQTNKDIELTGSVPIGLSPSDWQLIIVQHAADVKLDMPIAFFSLPAQSEPDAVGTGKVHAFTNREGTYTAELKSVQRLPWEEEDLINASLLIGNKGEESLPLPELKGHFMLDENIKVETKLVRTDKVIGVGSGGSVHYQFVGKIPYTYEFSKVKLVLQEKPEGSGDGGSTGGGTDSSTAENLLEFVHSSELMSAPSYNVGEPYQVTSVGRKTDYHVRSLMTYTGDLNDTLAVRLEAVNQEKRFNAVSKLVAYFKMADGTVFPAQYNPVKTKVTPGSPALLLLTSVVPKNLDTKGMQLLIGDAITQDKLTDGDNKADAYVNAASFWLPAERTEVLPKLKEIDLYPYKLSMSRIHTRGDENGIHLYFDYELTKNALVETNVDNRKLIISLEDREDKVRFSWNMDFKEFESLNNQEGVDPLQNKTGQLKLGKKELFRLDKNDREFIFLVSYLKDYDLKVYEAFNDHKKLLASQKITWFETTD